MIDFGVAFIIFTVLPYSYAQLCTKQENYTVTSKETYVEPVVVNTFTWCLQIPPRCPKTRTEMRQRYRIKSEVKTRLVSTCCAGYREERNSEDDAEPFKCVPICENCFAGICISPEKCQCDPGYQGDDCSHECLPGSWGVNCEEECNCGKGTTCDPFNGICDCPPGFRGRMCEEPCAVNKWGPNCINNCKCKNVINRCDSETGKCYYESGFTVVRVSPIIFLNRTQEMIPAQTSTDSSTTFRSTNFDRRKTVEMDYSDLPIREGFFKVTKGKANIPDSSVSKIEYKKSDCPHGFWGTDCAQKCNCKSDVTCDPVNGTCLCPLGFYGATCSEPCPIDKWGPNCTNSLPTSLNRTRETIVGDSTGVVPSGKILERGKSSKKERRKFAEIHETFLRHVENTVGLQDNALPKTDYIKTVHKEEVSSGSPVPLDIVLIVVASIISLGLTSVAVAMVLHMRSKLFETVRLSIYDEENTKCQKRESVNAGRASTIVTSALPQPTLRVNPAFGCNSEMAATLTIDNVDQINAYANGVAALGLRISGDLRDFLQDGHYDRPTATLIRLQSNVESTEHLYDEIPLQSTPQCTRKSA